MAASDAPAPQLSECERAGLAAEQAAGLPPGLLLAIGRVESGRWDGRLRRTIPWPWTVDAAGDGHLFDSKGAALQAVPALARVAGRNLDIGCFQISMLHHPDAFADLDEAFDPRANASYAARFLVSLKQRLGSWDQAVMAYHSANPELGLPYRARVMAQWAQPDPIARQAEAPAGPVGDPHVVVSSGDTGVRVWTPAGLQAAAAAGAKLPTIIALPAPDGRGVMVSMRMGGAPR